MIKRAKKMMNHPLSRFPQRGKAISMYSFPPWGKVGMRVKKLKNFLDLNERGNQNLLNLYLVKK